MYTEILKQIKYKSNNKVIYPVIWKNIYYKLLWNVKTRKKSYYREKNVSLYNHFKAFTTIEEH